MERGRHADECGKQRDAGHAVTYDKPARQVDSVQCPRSGRSGGLHDAGEPGAASAELRESGISLRDLGTLLGVSHQRADQLTKPAWR
ncbi:MAG: hypothetical protein ACRDSR_26175 [Pseudonocardiaceae bacterium]